MKIIKRFELNDTENNLVDAILMYMREGGKQSEDAGYEMLGELLYNILDRRGYEGKLGEICEWDDDWENIVIYYSEEDEEKEKRFEEFHDDYSERIIESNADDEVKQKLSKKLILDYANMISKYNGDDKEKKKRSGKLIHLNNKK